jgi:hypothetical protein
MSRNSLSKLSRQQKALLQKALKAFYWMEKDLACGTENPGSFELRAGKVTDPETMLPLKITDRRGRANRRAAAGHAVVRLVDGS